IQLALALKETGYITSVVLKITPIPKGKYWSLRKDELVSASVENIYELQSDITEEKITENIKNKVPGATFNATDLCDSNACDSNTTTCEARSGDFNCTCKKGYVKSTYSTRICTACPSGEKAPDDNTRPCVPCPFGYSGFNCNESWELVLVIVGSVLGGLLLITLIALPLVMRKSSKSSKKNPMPDIGNAYISHSPAKSPLVNRESANQQPAYANAGVPRIPRATTNSWDRGTNLEMTPSNSRQNLVPAGRSMMHDDRDVRNGNLNAPNRGQTNPYGQNPYAQSRGVTNTHYQHDDGRRLY
ncbi:mucin-13-like, partial [Myripristis murdjan]|uniref:mucin-13-like n=1 Tax=Myripristis murdjan TaxID=586833 RepID=UPI001176041C